MLMMMAFGAGMGYGMGYGHGGHMSAAVAIFSLVVSAAFLVWLGEKRDNPYQKLGKVIAWVAIVLSSLIILGSIAMCIGAVVRGGCPLAREMEEPMRGMGMQYGPGWMRPGMGMGMRQGMGMPPAMPRPPVMVPTPEPERK